MSTNYYSSPGKTNYFNGWMKVEKKNKNIWLMNFFYIFVLEN